MQVKQNSDLVSYELTDEELANGSQLHYLQKAVIQNERITLMQELINLKPDDMTASGKETYWQREAYIRGQLDILTHLITKSTTYESLNPTENTQGN